MLFAIQGGLLARISNISHPLFKAPKVKNTTTVQCPENQKYGKNISNR